MTAETKLLAKVTERLEETGADIGLVGAIQVIHRPDCSRMRVKTAECDCEFKLHRLREKSGTSRVFELRERRTR